METELSESEVPGGDPEVCGLHAGYDAGAGAAVATPEDAGAADGRHAGAAETGAAGPAGAADGHGLPELTAGPPPKHRYPQATATGAFSCCLNRGRGRQAI